MSIELGIRPIGGPSAHADELEQDLVAAGNPLLRSSVRKISNCSWDCSKDVCYTFISAGVSTAFGWMAATVPNERANVICGIASAGFGLVALTYIVYGVTIRSCPSSHHFWFRS
jgi:hypothetical protein